MKLSATVSVTVQPRTKIKFVSTIGIKDENGVLVAYGRFGGKYSAEQALREYHRHSGRFTTVKKPEAVIAV